MHLDPNSILSGISRERSERSMPVSGHGKADGAEGIRRVAELGPREELRRVAHRCTCPSHPRVRRIESSAGRPVESSCDPLRIGHPVQRDADHGEYGEEQDDEEKPGFAGNAAGAGRDAHPSSPQFRKLIFIVWLRLRYRGDPGKEPRASVEFIVRIPSDSGPRYEGSGSW